MTSIILATLLAQTPLGPELAPGTNEWFQQGMVAVMRDLEAGRFAVAAKKVAHLPDRKVTMTWIDRGLTPIQKSEFLAVRDRAVAGWKEVMPDVSFSWVPTGGEIQFSFAPTLPPNAESPGPAGAVFLTSQDPKDPTVDAVIALRRGTAKAPAVGRDVHNEVVYAIGAHFGLARIPVPGFAMFRTESTYFDWLTPVRSQSGLVNENLNAVEVLKKAALAKKKLRPALPSLSLQPMRFDAKPVVQGDPIQFSIQVTNRGTAPLRYLVVPDCGCFTVRQGAAVKVGETIAIPVSINTMDFPGIHDKVLYLYSNDPENPVRIFPVTFQARPRYRFLWNEPTDVLQVDETGRVATVFLTLEGDKPLKILEAHVNGGATGLVEYEPWEGELPDAFYKEPSRRRKGYKFELLFGSSIGDGRRTVSLEIETDDPVFKNLHFPFYLQKGIVALPQFVYLGEVRLGQAAQATSRISRPGKPFKIVRVESDSPSLSATWEAIPDKAEFRLNIQFKGRADSGDYAGKLTIHTDDPAQPTLIVDVSAKVK